MVIEDWHEGAVCFMGVFKTPQKSTHQSVIKFVIKEGVEFPQQLTGTILSANSKHITAGLCYVKI